jgi:glycosyltransferase involved in cell wall biosynthesis
MIREGRALSLAESPAISVIIPMFNEQDNARDTIRRVIETLEPSGLSFEIIPVNDGSTDRTLEILEEIARADGRVRVGTYRKNGGRGKALRHGFSLARGDYVASIDADLSYDPKYILEMARTLDAEGDIDVVLASPYMEGGSAVGVSPNRLFISRMGNKILKAALPEEINTITCVVRCYRRGVLDSLDLESDGKEIHLEILSKVLAMGYKVREIPATLTSRKKGKSKFAFKATAFSHIVFTVFERPSLLFGLLGMLVALVGLGIGVYIMILYSLQALNPTRPLLTLMVLFILGGMQILSFGFLASQINFLRRDVLLNRKAIARLMSQRGPSAPPDDGNHPQGEKHP